MPHVLVTGAASGIGRAIAESFAAEGDNRVDLVDIDEPRLEAVARAVGAQYTCVDLADPDGPQEAVRRCWESRGEIDILVNAAGIYPSLDMIEVRPAEWDRIFALNTRAPALTTAALARYAVDAGRGASVVNISSGAALRSRPGGGPYASSKAALEMATRAAALELGPYGIRVNAVSPGFVTVDSACNPVSEEYERAVSVNPLGRAGTPADIASAVRWIAGREASWVTGEILRVDGGSGTGVASLPRIWPPAHTRQEREADHTAVADRDHTTAADSWTNSEKGHRI